MQNKTVVLALAMGLVGGMIGGKIFIPKGTEAAHKETSFERVMRTKTLRCGYASWEPGIRKDPSGAMSGTWVDITSEVAKTLNLKLEWAAEVGWGDVSTALKTGKIDMMCAGMWESGSQAKELYFSTPVAYEGLEAFIRADDKRFNGDVSKVNDPAIKLVVRDKDNSDFVADANFPKAQKVSLPLGSVSDGDFLVYVATHKADVAFVSPDEAAQYSAKNPGQIVSLAPHHYLRMFGQTLAMDNDDPRLVHAVNVAIDEAVSADSINRILAKYKPEHPERFLVQPREYK